MHVSNYRQGVCGACKALCESSTGEHVRRLAHTFVDLFIVAHDFPSCRDLRWLHLTLKRQRWLDEAHPKGV
jgi:hypothetical protein